MLHQTDQNGECQGGGQQKETRGTSERNIEGEEKLEKLYYLFISVLLVCYLVLYPLQVPISVYLESARRKPRRFLPGNCRSILFFHVPESLHSCMLSAGNFS